MPSELKTLDEARAYWLLVQRRNYHFNIIANYMLADSNASVNSKIRVKNGYPRKLEQWSVDNLARPSIPNTHQSSTLALKAQMESSREK